MSDRARAQTQTTIGQNFLPASAALQRKCACGQHTIGGGQCGGCSRKRVAGLSQQESGVSQSSVNAESASAPDLEIVRRADDQPSGLASSHNSMTSLDRDLALLPVSASSPLRIQAKLNISQPGDPHELEADHTAEQVMSMREPAGAQSELRSQPQAKESQGKASQTKGGALQAKAATGGATAATQSSHPQLATITGSGKPISESARSFMEPRFGRDFSHVRVHTGARAAESAQSFNAQAYTVGRDIVFGNGYYQPETAGGRRLLAHELTHVVQQQSGASAAVQRQTIPEDFTEIEAQDYLLKLDATGKIEDNMNSDNKARAIVNAWRVGGSPFELTAQRKILLIQEMQSGFTGDEDEQAILEILERSYNFELSMIFSAIAVDDLNSDFHTDEWGWLQDFYSRRFEGGMQAMLKGSIKPKGAPLPFGAQLPRPGEYMIDELPGAKTSWDPLCVLGILCSMDSAVVTELGKLKVKQMDRIDVQKWTFDGNVWSSKIVHPVGLNKPDEKLIGIVRKKSDCNDAAQTLFHEVRHQTQPQTVRGTKYTMEMDAYTETEKWAIGRGLPEPGSRNKSLRVTDQATGNEKPDPVAIDQMVEQKYGGKTSVPGDEIVDHKEPAKTVVKHADGTTSDIASKAGDTYLAEPPTLINEQLFPASTWTCPKTKTP
jgi:uncharacterized protein DUF4157